MKTSKWSVWVPGVLGVCVALLTPAMSPRARAFGGLWSAEPGPVNQAGLQIVFVDNPDATVTAVVQIRYAGEPEQFAWLIPVPGTPVVGMSSSTVFQRLEAATAPEYWVEVAHGATCMHEPEYPEPSFDAGIGSGDTPVLIDTTASVAVNEAGSAGPYDYVNIEVDPTLDDPSGSAVAWLTANGYRTTNVDRQVLAPYLRDGFHLLAFKLKKGADIGAIRPVTLTYESELPAIPIKPAAVAAQPNLGIQVWVFGPSQAVPDNYKSLVLNDARIDWLSGQTFPKGTLPKGGAGPFGGGALKKPANYESLVTAAADEAGGQGFVTELGGPASQYRDKVWSPVDDEAFDLVADQSYADGIDAIVNAHSQYGSWDGWNDAVAGATALPEGVTLEAFAHRPDDYRGGVQVDSERFFELLREHVVQPVAETGALLYAAPYLTRLYTTMSAEEMTVDPVFAYNADLDQVSNVHVARQGVECGEDGAAAAWSIELPQGGVITGEGSAGWPAAVEAMPANLKVVMLSGDGSGTVVKDNSQAIAMTLLEGVGTLGGRQPFQPPQHGVRIGGSQTVLPEQESQKPDDEPEPEADPGSDDGGCSVSHARGRLGIAVVGWLVPAALVLARRRRRRQDRVS